MMESLEEFLAKVEPKPSNWISTSILALLSLLSTALLGLLPKDRLREILIPIIGILALVSLALLIRLAKKVSETRRLERDLQELRDGQLPPKLDDQEYSILCMIYDAPGKVQNDGLRKKLYLSDGDLHCSLKRLFDLRFIKAPLDGLNDPPGYWPLSDGCSYVKNRRNT